jgi:HNH endonuclease
MFRKMSGPGAATTALAPAEPWLRGNDMPEAMPIETRFWKHAGRGDDADCWEWRSHRTKDGYGTFWNGERRANRNPVTVLAHRWAYERFIGPIPDGEYVCHRCDNPPCVNPAHLFAATQHSNVRDCIAKGRHRNGRGFLTDAQIAEVRAQYRGEYGDRARLAHQYGVTSKVIGSIVRDLPRVYGRWRSE